MPLAAANLDWLYHLLGYTLAAAGLLLLLWALFWDRSRGRKRCPKCWYDMSGVQSLTCAECGGSWRDQRSLLRTRRRWKFACAGVMVCYLAIATSRLSHEGWSAYVPTTALLAGIRWLPGERSPTLGPVYASRKDSSSCGWSARVLQVRIKHEPAWLRGLARSAAFARIDADLNRYPPRISSIGSVGLLESLLGGQNPAYDAALYPLAAIELIGPSVSPVGSPLCVRVDVAGLGAADVLVDIQAMWPDSRPVRAYGMTPGGELSAAFSDRYYSVPMVSLGVPPSPADWIEVTATIRRKMEPIDSRTIDSLPVVRTRRFRLPIRIVDHEQAALQAAAVQWPLQGGWGGSDKLLLVDNAYERGQWELWTGTMDVEAPHGVTFAARVQVRCEGTTYFTGEWCWWKELQGLKFPWGGPPHLAPISLHCRLTPDRPLTASPEAMGSWTVHLSGDSDVARWNINAVQFWSGEIDLPVEVRSSPRQR